MLVGQALERYRQLLALTEKPSHLANPATPGGIPISWSDFQRTVIGPHVERLEGLLTKIDAGQSYP